MNKYEFIDGDIELIDYVKPLWEKLNDHHRANSNYFDYRFLKFKFDDRKNKFINDNNIDVKIDLIKDTERDLYIGYCISTINKDLVGEIDSLFIEV
ncbi:MAG: GNAT family N-acetyltransferase, partial [Paraclostridium sp.]